MCLYSNMLIMRVPKNQNTDNVFYPLVGDYYPKKDWLDGGDTAHRTGFMFTILYFLIDYEENIDKAVLEEIQSHSDDGLRYLECPWAPGIGRRHPHKGYWYSDDDRESRDQGILLRSWASFWNKPLLWRMFKAHAKRGFLFMSNTRRNGATKANHGQKQNPYTDEKFDYSWKMPDFTFFGVWAQYIRGLNLWFLYPLLCIFDFSLFFNALIIRNTDQHDIFQHIVQCLQAKKQLPTPLSWFTNRYLNDPEQIMEKCRYYMRTEDYEKGVRIRPMFLVDMAEKVVYTEFGNNKEETDGSTN